MTTAEDFDPFSGGGGKFALLRRLREAGPLARVAGGMAYVTRHAECRAVLRDTGVRTRYYRKEL